MFYMIYAAKPTSMSGITFLKILAGMLFLHLIPDGTLENRCNGLFIKEFEEAFSMLIESLMCVWPL